MVKHTRKCQKGGDWYNPMSWFNNANTYAPKKTLVESASELTGKVTNAAEGALNSAEGALGSVASASQNAWNKTTEAAENVLNQDVQPTTNSVGGKRRKHKTMKGGKGGLGLTYYATPVSNMNVVEPTYWEDYPQNGGSKKRNKRRIKTRRNKRRIKTRRNKTRRNKTKRTRR